MLSNCVQNDQHTILLTAGMMMLLGLIGCLLFSMIGLVALVLGSIFFILAGQCLIATLVF